MATTINQYSVGLTLDAKQYIDASKLSASETRKLTADINQARDPTEKYSLEHDRLKRALEAGAISEATYNRLLDTKKQKLDAANSALEKHSTALDTLSKVGNVVTGTYHAIKGAITTAMAPINLVREMWEAFDEVADKLDDTWKSAQKLGLSFNEMAGIRLAAEEIAGSADALDKAIIQMMKRGFAGPDVLQSFMDITDEISAMSDQSERVKRAFEVFGKGGTEILVMLQGGTAAIRDSVAFQREWNNLTDAQVMGVEAYNDAWARVGIIIDGTTNKLAAELSPAMKLIADDAIAFATAMKGSEVSIRDVADFLIINVSLMKSLAEDAAKIAGGAGLIASGQLKAGVDMLGSLEDPVTTAVEFMKRVDAERKKLEAAAEQKAKERQQTRLAEIGQQHDAHEELFRKWNEDQDRLASTALDKARQHFEQERQRDMKMRTAASAGPASMEVGSREAAKYLADEVNNRIGAAAVPDKPTPGEDELIAKAAEQVKIMEEEKKTNLEQLAAIRELVEVGRANGFKRIR